MEKIVSHPGKVEDLYGLFSELKKSGFALRNVGADEKGTYIFLEADEEKDPLPIIRDWLGKPAPVMTEKEAAKRLKEAGTPPKPEPPKPSFVKRIFSALRRKK